MNAYSVYYISLAQSIKWSYSACTAQLIDECMYVEVRGMVRFWFQLYLYNNSWESNKANAMYGVGSECLCVRMNNGLDFDAKIKYIAIYYYKIRFVVANGCKSFLSPFWSDHFCLSHMTHLRLLFLCVEFFLFCEIIFCKYFLLFGIVNILCLFGGSYSTRRGYCIWINLNTKQLFKLFNRKDWEW